jgi:hypothetical protein
MGDGMMSDDEGGAMTDDAMTDREKEGLGSRH